MPPAASHPGLGPGARPPAPLGGFLSVSWAALAVPPPRSPRCAGRRAGARPSALGSRGSPGRVSVEVGPGVRPVLAASRSAWFGPRWARGSPASCGFCRVCCGSSRSGSRFSVGFFLFYFGLLFGILLVVLWLFDGFRWPAGLAPGGVPCSFPLPSSALRPALRAPAPCSWRPGPSARALSAFAAPPARCPALSPCPACRAPPWALASGPSASSGWAGWGWVCVSAARRASSSRRCRARPAGRAAWSAALASPVRPVVCFARRSCRAGRALCSPLASRAPASVRAGRRARVPAGSLLGVCRARVRSLALSCRRLCALVPRAGCAAASRPPGLPPSRPPGLARRPGARVARRRPPVGPLRPSVLARGARRFVPAVLGPVLLPGGRPLLALAFMPVLRLLRLFAGRRLELQPGRRPRRRAARHLGAGAPARLVLARQPFLRLRPARLQRRRPFLFSAQPLLLSRACQINTTA